MERRQSKGKRPHRKVCSFCVEKVTYIDYKEVSCPSGARSCRAG